MAAGDSVSFPTPYLVLHERCIGVSEDEDGMGDDVPTFDYGIDRPAYGWRAHRKENVDGHSSRVVAEVDLAMPSAPVGLMDRFTINGEVFEAVGIRDNNNGFHGWQPGIVVELKRVTG